jgi:hypothetical protein
MPHSINDQRFDDSERLRSMLFRLHRADRQTWAQDTELEEFLGYITRRFALFAIQHGADPADAASAAFEAIRNPSARLAFDPWGLIVRGITTTIRAAQFADEALCSVETARRGNLAGMRAERFSEQETEIWTYHPAFAITDHHDDDDADTIAEPEDLGPSIREQIAQITWLFTLGGWAFAQTSAAVEIVLNRLSAAGSRTSAYESLRRDKRTRAILNLPHDSWIGLLRLVLGNPDPARIHTKEGRGILLRMALGQPVEALAADSWLAERITASAPPRRKAVTHAV